MSVTWGGIIVGAAAASVLLGLIVALKDKLKSIFADIFKLILKIKIFSRNRRIKKLMVKYNFEAEVNMHSKQINKEFPRLLPFKVKLHWCKEKDKVDTLFGKDNTIIIVLEEDIDSNVNAIRATIEYVRTGFFPDVSVCFPAIIREGSYLVLTEKIINEFQSIPLEHEFSRYVLKNIFARKSNIYEVYNKLSLLDKRGIFTRIFLNECLWTIDSLINNIPATLPYEIAVFLDYITGIAESELGDGKMKLDHITKNIKVSLIPVAEGEKFSMFGDIPYIKKAENLIKTKRIKSIYILGMGKKVRAAKIVAKEFENKFHWNKSEIQPIVDVIDARSYIERKVKKYVVGFRKP